MHDNTEYVSFTEANLQLKTQGPAVAVEYDLGEAGDIQQSLDIAMSSLVFAIDASLRNPEKRSALESERLSIMHRAMVGAGLPAQLYEDTHYESRNPEALQRLGVEFSREVLHPFNGPMPHSPASKIYSGYNQLGDIVVSKGYNNDSPQRTGIYDGHWHNRFLGVDKIGKRTLAVGVYQDGQQHLELDELRKELERPELASMVAGRPNVRVAEVQPQTISELWYGASAEPLDSRAPNAVRLGAVREFLAAKGSGLETYYYNDVNATIVAIAQLSVLHDHSDLGISLKIEAFPKRPSPKVWWQERDSRPAIVVADADGRPADLAALSVSVKPVIWTPGEPGGSVGIKPLHTTQDILITPERLEAVEEMNFMIAAIRKRLIAENS